MHRPGRPARSSVAGRRPGSATSGPKMPTWSVVWLALVPRSRAGRSAVTTTSGDAGVRGLEDGRVQVRDAGAGRADHRGARCRSWSGRARGSRRCARRCGCAGGPARRPRRRTPRRRAGRCASPGATTISVTPASISAVTTARASCGGAHGRSILPHAPGPRPAGPPSARPGRGRRATSGLVDDRQPHRQHRRRPAAAARSTTSRVEQLHGGQAAGVRQLGQRRGQRDPGRDPDAGLQRRRDHHRQPDVLGDPQAGAHPAERLHLEHGDVGGLEVADPVGVGGPADRLVGGDRHVRRARRTTARSSTLAHRLLDVLQAAGGAVEHGDRARPRCRRPRAPLASMRIRPSGPSASRTASSRAWSSARVWPGSATLTLAVRQPPREHDRVRLLGPDRRARSR